MSGFNELITGFKKDFGTGIGGIGADVVYEPIARIPTGWFSFDLASGGGVPIGKITEIYGKESSGKTNMAMRVIANFQKLYPHLKCIFFDIEHTYDKKWAGKLGVDTDALYVFRPDYGEALVDMMEGLLGSPECGLVVIDSLAAVVTTRELEQSAEKQDVGGSGMVMSKLIRKCVAALTRAEKDGYTPTILAINQTRNKIGVMFGNPESTPGGDVKNFAFSMRVRLYGKDHKNAKYHDSLPVCKDISFSIKKHKCPIVATSGDMLVVMIPHKGLGVGECDDFKLVQKYLEKHDVLVKNKTKWELLGNTYSTLKEIRDMLRNDVILSTEIKAAIISTEVNAATGDVSDSLQEVIDLETGEVTTEPKPKKKKAK